MANAVMMAYHQQSEALQAFGLAVKNTFIDSPTSSQELSTGRASRRSRSVPPVSSNEVSTSSRIVRVRHSDEKDVLSSPMSSNSTGCFSREQSPEISFDCQSSDDASSSPSETEESETSRESSFCDEEEQLAAEELGSLVVRECSFLRVTGFGLHEESNRIRRQRGAAKCVMLYVKSLPWAKRAKWLHPLLRSVAALLQAKGCATKMQGGELYAKLESSRNLARLDFAAARSC
jgi:hypothetical protein